MVHGVRSGVSSTVYVRVTVCAVDVGNVPKTEHCCVPACLQLSLTAQHRSSWQPQQQGF